MEYCAPILRGDIYDCENSLEGGLAMHIKIARFDAHCSPTHATVDVDIPEGLTLLQALLHIKATADPTLTFKAGCRSGICGICGVRVNGKEELACACKPNEGDLVEPLQYHRVMRDLAVEKKSIEETLCNATAWLHHSRQTTISVEEEKRTEVQSDCMLCALCYSACPVFAVNENFLGPFALTRVYRYTADPREEDIKSAIDAIQSNGVWDCTLCGACTAVCPQGIDPKMDITQLRSTSAQFGYGDPNFMTMNFGF